METTARAFNESRVGMTALSLLVVAAGATPLLAQAPTDWSKVAEALGKAGSVQPGDVYKVSLPRSDLHVTAAEVPVEPALALGSWVAFKQTGSNEATAMGDLVLLESEVGAVVRKLQEQGVEQTAIHNHLLHESPRVMYVHIRGQGDPVKLAAAIPRAEKVTDGGMEVPPAMGVATALNFQPTGPKRAAITGDFVLIGSEVNPVIKTLRQNGIQVTALHSHMLDELPRLFFMHFWANDDAVKLATGLRAALDRMNVKRAS